MIRKGDTITFKPEFRDPGDENAHYIAMDEEEKGRVMVMCIDSGLPFPPRHVVPVWMIEGR